MASVKVRFRTAWRCYNSGEVAGPEPQLARWLVEQRLADIVKAPAPPTGAQPSEPAAVTPSAPSGRRRRRRKKA